MDKIQREVLSKEELDMMYIATTNQVEVMNKLRTNRLEPKELDKWLKQIKADFKNEKDMIEEDVVDIFGGLSEDTRKTKKLANKTHREQPKNKYSILRISKATKLVDYKVALNNAIIIINNAIKKNQLTQEVCAYKWTTDGKNLDTSEINVFNLNLVVAINKYHTDTTLELTFIKNELEKNNIEYSVCEGYTSGSIDSINLAKKVLDLCKLDNKFKCAYNLDDNLFDKIDKVAKLIYKASKVNYKDSVIDKINNLSDEFKNYPICIAKTPYSLSSDSKNLLCDNDYTLDVTDIEIKSGAKFIIVYTGKILTLPGLGARPNYENIDILNDSIVGIF